MPREKTQRNLNFKPIVTEYIPSSGKYNGVSKLLHEEIEAIYLMDVLNLYQEDAAKKMGISRPTFTRIIKSARQKLTHGLISGYKIVLEDDKKDLVIAFCTNDINTFELIDPKQEIILIYHIKDNTINLIDEIKNPISINNSKPAIELPKILLDYNVNTFISSKIGEGLKHSLMSKGINPLIQDTISINYLKSMTINNIVSIR